MGRGGHLNCYVENDEARNGPRLAPLRNWIPNSGPLIACNFLTYKAFFCGRFEGFS